MFLTYIFIFLFLFPVFGEIKIIQNESIPTTLVFPPYLHSYGIRKATQSKLKLLLNPLASFKNPQGIVAVKMNSRDDKSTEEDDDELTVYGVNSGRHEIIYNTSMYGITSYGKKGTGKGNFNSPMGITATPKGDVYIADTRNNRIVHLFNPQKKVKWIEAIGKKGNRKGEFNLPEGVATDSRGILYIADTKNNRIQIINLQTNNTKLIETKKLNEPTQLAVADISEQWSYYRENAIFVVDNNHKRIQKINFNGDIVSSVSNWPDKKVEYEYISLDYYNNVYVTDIKGNCIYKFDHNLKPITHFGSQGTKDRQFVEPRGITIWKRYGQVFIAEKNGAQYYWIGTDSKETKLTISDNNILKLKIYPTEFSFVSIFAVSQTDTIKIINKKMIKPKKEIIKFKNPLKRLNSYLFYVQLEPTYSSYTYFAKRFLRNIQQ